jgi:AraC family transcriptional activator of tynA and feaB
MQPLFSTSKVHPRDRFNYWHDVACNSVVFHDAEPDNRQTFRGELRSGMLGSLGLVTFENSPMNVNHTPRHIAHSRGDEIFICRQETGLLTLEQDSRELTLQAGRVALLDPRLPYKARFTGSSKTLVVKLPRRSLRARAGETRDLSVLPLAGSGDLLSSVLATLPACSDQVSQLSAASVGESVLDLISVSIAQMHEGHPRISSARSLALMNIRAAVESRLTDPSLDAATVAAAAGVGVRYANAIQAEEGTSVTRLMLTRRLERCRKAFDDPSQAHRKISEIAYGWGFSDMTHFGRRFRSAYGVLPGDYRRRASGK